MLNLEPIKKPAENSVILLLNSYLDVSFDVLHAAIGNRHQMVMV